MVDLEVRQCRQSEDQAECDERCDRGKAFEVVDVLDLGEAFGDIRLRCETLERVPFSSRLSLKVHRPPMTRVPFGVSARLTTVQQFRLWSFFISTSHAALNSALSGARIASL